MMALPLTMKMPLLWAENPFVAIAQGLYTVPEGAAAPGCAVFAAAGRLRCESLLFDFHLPRMKTPVGSDNVMVGDLLAADPALRDQLDVPGGVASIGRDLLVTGDISAATHLVIEGRVDGQVAAPEHSVAVSEHGRLNSDVFAQSITVGGTVMGNLTATRSLKILSAGRVEGRLVAPRVAIDDGAVFNGKVDTHLTEAAAAVKRHRLRERTRQTAS